MTRVIEISAKSPEEAVEIALKEFDVELKDVEVEILSPGKSGILGIGSEPARVRVTVLDEPADVVGVTTEILHDLLSLMGVSATVTLREAEREDVGGPAFDIDGDDSGLLIGRRGETVRAIQFLVSFMAGQRLGDRVNLFVDVAGYQERRYESVTILAHRVARRVAADGRSVALDPMPPNERRVVHMALADHPDVSTASTGEGDGRKVVVQLIE